MDNKVKSNIGSNKAPQEPSKTGHNVPKAEKHLDNTENFSDSIFKEGASLSQRHDSAPSEREDILNSIYKFIHKIVDNDKEVESVKFDIKENSNAREITFDYKRRKFSFDRVKMQVIALFRWFQNLKTGRFKE